MAENLPNESPDRESTCADGLSPVVRGYPRFGCRVIAGAEAGRFCLAEGPELSIGSAAGNELRLVDPTVSRYHCAIRATATGVKLRDLGSTNGTWVAGIRVESAWIDTGAVLRLGLTRVRFEAVPGEMCEPLAEECRMGPLVGQSAAMRGLFARLERLAAGDQAVLLMGPPGSGKRLGGAPIRVPSLAERTEDVPLLVSEFWRELRGDPEAEPPGELVARLVRLPWPGNVEQLRAQVARAARAPALLH